jgi:asparagine synthase (glutamine-hydrolysing)
MCRIQTHRGPDEQAVYLKEHVGLGHCRLSIVDLQTGHQPLSNEDKSVWIVFNGEIYNDKEIRDFLLKKGHLFATDHSDTEVIIHLYEEYGSKCLDFLRGMFAFAIWDEREERFFLARDRLGQKPLFYTTTEGSFIFASEIKALLQSPEVGKEIDEQALHYYFTYQYIPAPLSIFKKIKSLPAAHFLVWEKGEIRIERYWQVKYLPKIKQKEKDCQEKFLDLLAESVKLRLKADVPVGTFLSGGIDSSSIVFLAQKFVSQRLRTFSVGFEEFSFDETPFARIVAEIFKTKHYQFIVKPEIFKNLPQIVWHLNQPFSDSSVIPTYYLSSLASSEVKVCLSGDGGDELLAGYDRYQAHQLVGYYQKIPSFIRQQLLVPLVSLLPETTNKKCWKKRIKRFIKGAEENFGKRILNWGSPFESGFEKYLYHPEMKGRIKEIKPDLLTNPKLALLDQLLAYDTHFYLPDDLLVKVDLMGMANSLEVRSPFLDHKLVEYTAQLPPSLKLKGFTSKYILKKCLKGNLPSQIINRRKAGFGVPVGDWFKKWSQKGMMKGILLETSDPFLKRDFIEKIWQEHLAGKKDESNKLWAILVFKIWYLMFIENKISKETELE